MPVSQKRLGLVALQCALLTAVPAAALVFFQPWPLRPAPIETPRAPAETSTSYDGLCPLKDVRILARQAEAPKELAAENETRVRLDAIDPNSASTRSPLQQWQPGDRWTKGYVYRFDFFLGDEY